MNKGRVLLFKACLFVVLKLSVFNLMCVTFCLLKSSGQPNRKHGFIND